MAVRPEGTPCWADAMFTDLEGAKTFYGAVLGWTFGEASSEFGNYTQAFKDGKAVAAVVPPMPGEDSPSAWCLYLASPDAAATVERIRAAGGEVLMEAMQVGDFGTMALAKEPTGAVFGVWQADKHEGFEKIGEPGAYAWAELCTRDTARTDAFLSQVFPYRAQQMAEEGVDYRVYNLGENPVLGRMEMGSEFPAGLPPFVCVYFAVDDCDAAVAKATELGGSLQFGPMDSPFGRFAAVTDPQGAAFAVIDPGRTEGAMPALTDVA
ncbi:VOC family protein [Kitasatospora sp. NPDC059571]|uniref:VOC family protein n=1 Tax=Kitasatospora sp. NPDC059571 TaxID=3346871 RepID=UPI0036AEA004